MVDQLVIAGPASQGLAVRVAHKLDVPVVSTECKQFPDGENYLRIEVDDEKVVQDKDVIIIQTTGADALGDQNQRFMELIMMIAAVRRMQPHHIRVVVPYFAYSRQDKAFRPGECKFAQELLRMLEHAGADEFYTVDVHAKHVFNSLDIPAYNLDPMAALAAEIQTRNLHQPVVVCPDKGAYDRSRKFAHHLGDDVEVVQFHKKRDVKTGEITMEGDISVDGKDVIIADDIIATGGTMSLALKIAKQGGAKSVYAVGTHPLLIKNATYKLLTAGTTDLIGTDTINSPVMDVSMADVIIDAIKGHPLK